jgi:hypothetical protein
MGSRRRGQMPLRLSALPRARQIPHRRCERLQTGPLSTDADRVMDFAGVTPCSGEDAGQEPPRPPQPRQAEHDLTS